MGKSLRLWPLVSVLVLGLTACQTTQNLGRVAETAKGEKPLGERLSELLDGQCPIPVAAQEDPRTFRRLKLLRAEWFLAVATRFGAARIPEYSPDPATDAAILHSQLLKTMRHLREAESEVERDPNLYELARADLTLAILRAGYYAIEPAIEAAGGRMVSFVVRPDADKALRAAERLFQDHLYADAYRLTCSGHISWVIAQRDAATGETERASAVDAALATAKERVEAHFLSQCGRVAGLAGLEEECRWPGK